jgi:hypothetical protein
MQLRTRYFTGTTRDLSRGGNKSEVIIDGTQNADGTVEWLITLVADGRECVCDITSDRAREIGQALIAAADELDRLAGQAVDR